MIPARSSPDAEAPVTVRLALRGTTRGAPTARLLTADAPLPAATRTLRHPDGDLHVYLGPVGADPRTLEAVVDRTGGRA